MPSGKANLTADNPLGDIINIIPWKLSVLDIELLDAIRALVTKYNPGYFYTNKYILVLLDHLMSAGYIYMHQIKSEEVPGVTILIMRV